MLLVKNKLVVLFLGLGTIFAVFSLIQFLLLDDDGSAFAQDSVKNPKDITYTVKFVCGSVFDDKGPIRPGHYDTSISILNKKNMPIDFFWNVIVNDGLTSHSVLQKLGSEQSTGITCEKIREVASMESSDTSLFEGFIVIGVPLDYSPSSPSTITMPASGDIDFFDVQVFYTANALDTLPHETLSENISFYIIDDKTGKIPENTKKTLLDITIPTTFNEISNTESKVREALGKQFGMSQEEQDQIVLRIKGISLGVGSLIDDHAISLQRVVPQISS